MSGDHDYAAGLRDGKIEALEKMEITQNERLDHHGTRISKLEKVAYVILGIVLFLEFAPHLTNFFGG